MAFEFERDIHYYMDGTRVVFTALYHIQRGECCGNKCLHCPFEPKYEKGSTKIQDKFLENLNN